MTSPLISADELAALLGAEDLSVIDASWHLDGRDGRVDFEAARIPGAVFFDLEAASDHASTLPHMLPGPEAFADYAGSLGVSEADDIVVYDTLGLVSAARIWWMFTVMGAARVRVLDGGLPKWIAEGHPVEGGASAAPVRADFHARHRPETTAAFDDVVAALDGRVQIADARSAARFEGAAPEPRAGLRGGHMPGARSLPFVRLLNDDATFKRGDALAAAYRDAGLDPEKPFITSCGSGVTAAILTLGLAELGQEPSATSRLYDGSWAEWGGRADARIEP
ncbi:MAG: sulfurtransferase [Brevundimonas sp.]|nr:MAG: sulfurtransferase [Brevundimonas sp.]